MCDMYTLYYRGSACVLLVGWEALGIPYLDPPKKNDSLFGLGLPGHSYLK